MLLQFDLEAGPDAHGAIDDDLLHDERRIERPLRIVEPLVTADDQRHRSRLLDLLDQHDRIAGVPEPVTETMRKPPRSSLKE